MNRREFLKKCSTVAGGVALASSAGAHAAALLSNKSFGASVGKNKPNIIILLADDMGYSDLGCYDSEYIQTPNIDKLASQGDRCWVHSCTYLFEMRFFPLENPRGLANNSERRHSYL